MALHFKGHPASAAGEHLTPSQFHRMVATTGTEGSDVITVDCRNDYESKIGKFTDAVAPQVRKFSQWVEWTKKNVSNKCAKQSLENEVKVEGGEGGHHCGLQSIGIASLAGWIHGGERCTSCPDECTTSTRC